MTQVLDLQRVAGYFDSGPFVRKEHSIAIVGAGALGSWVGMTLARKGLPFTVYDPDVLKPHNIPNSAYFPDQVGKPKVEALRDLCLQFVDIEIHQQPASGLELDADFIFIGPDAMEVRQLECGPVLGRRELFENISSNLVGKEALIDGRIGSDFGEVYTIDLGLALPAHFGLYRERYLPKDAETTQGETACGGKIVLPQVVQMTASLMVSQLVTIYIMKFCDKRERLVAHRIALRTSPKLETEIETWPEF